LGNESQVDATQKRQKRACPSHAVDFTPAAVLKMVRAFNAAAVRAARRLAAFARPRIGIGGCFEN